jgi:hypothetical protein
MQEPGVGLGACQKIVLLLCATEPTLNEASSMGTPPSRDIGRLPRAWGEGDEHALERIAPLSELTSAPSQVDGI